MLFHRFAAALLHTNFVWARENGEVQRTALRQGCFSRLVDGPPRVSCYDTTAKLKLSRSSVSNPAHTLLFSPLYDSSEVSGI